MKFSPGDRDRAEYIRTVRVEDGPVHGQACSTTGRRFRVEHVKITYKLDPETGTWVVNPRFNVDLTGPVLKKDGTDSQNTHTRNAETRSWASRECTEEFAWVDHLVDALRPVGTPETPVFLRELEL